VKYHTTLRLTMYAVKRSKLGIVVIRFIRFLLVALDWSPEVR
jgi:hypothetical protein